MSKPLEDSPSEALGHLQQDQETFRKEKGAVEWGLRIQGHISLLVSQFGYFSQKEEEAWYSGSVNMFWQYFLNCTFSVMIIFFTLGKNDVDT